jgi:hypothetical protein
MASMAVWLLRLCVETKGLENGELVNRGDAPLMKEWGED